MDLSDVDDKKIDPRATFRVSWWNIRKWTACTTPVSSTKRVSNEDEDDVQFNDDEEVESMITSEPDVERQAVKGLTSDQTTTAQEVNSGVST